MKSLYICGDSFGYPDPEYGSFWVDFLKDKIRNNYQVINLSRVCASNLQISLQIDQAIYNRADFIIYLMTTSTREEVKHRLETDPKDLANRFTNVADQKSDTDITSYSVFSLDHTTVLENQQLDLLKEYHTSFFDLELTIYKNEIIIEGVLSRLQQSKIPFVYDQGGFENPKFTGTQDKIYFKNYLKHRSQINLWNFVHSKKHRPYYHIEDKKIHCDIAEYYYQRILNEKT